MKALFNSSIGRKFAMALSALFLMVFLLQHFLINLMSVLHVETFNKLSHFMGNNPLIQFALQPLLMFGVVYHFVMGFVLEIQNNKARVVKYAKNNGGANSSWFSRNMIWSGGFILLFILFHLNDFWVPEVTDKFINLNFPQNQSTNYLAHVQHMLSSPIRVGVYVLAFVFLSLHLLHGFSSAFQSVGVDSMSPNSSNRYQSSLQTFGKIYAVAIPTGFILIAFFHYFQSFNH